MKQISKVFIAAGLGTMFLGGMLDADGTYYVFLLIAMALGALVALVGVAIMDVENRREEKRKTYAGMFLERVIFMYYRQCRICGCSLDPGEGSICEECRDEQYMTEKRAEAARCITLDAEYRTDGNGGTVTWEKLRKKNDGGI